MDQMHDAGPSDRDLAHRWAAGDEQGYEQLVTRFAPMVHARCRRALGASDADDATQAVFLVLADKRAQAVASPALAAWLFTVADYVVLNALRDRKRRRQAEHSMPPRHDAEETTMDDLREHLDACLAELPAAERDAVRLHHLAGYTLAEVATHSKQPVSTIHARVQRGLERLRSKLVKRGVAVTSLALLANVQAHAAESVPVNVMAHLRDLNPAGKTGGATSAPSDRARRWSRPRISLMTRIALTGAAALLLGSASYHFLPAADQSPAHPAPQPTAAKPRLDPDKATMFGVMRWNDGARLVQRLRALPEASLLPPSAEPFLAKMAAIQQASLVIDPLFAATPELRRMSFAAQLDVDQETPEQYKTKQLAVMEAMTAQQASVPTLSNMFGRGSLTVADDHDDLLQMLSQALSQAAAPFKVGADRVQVAGHQLLVAPVPDSAFARLPESVLASRDPSADLEMNSFLDRGLGDGAELGGTMFLHLDARGASFVSHSEWGLTTPKQITSLLALPRIDRQRLESVPADALVAAMVAVDSTTLKDSQFWFGLRAGVEMPFRQRAAPADNEPSASGEVSVHALQPNAVTLETTDPVRKQIGTILDTVEQVNGHIVFWVQPGTPIPTMTLQADLSRPAAEALIASLGETPNAEGVVMLSLGPVLLQMGWKDGRLIATTRSDGLAGAVASGGFCANPEIQKALADMPATAPLGCVLLRSEALAAQVSPFLAMALPPESRQRFADYQHRLGTTQSYGSFRVDVTPDGINSEAHGLIALIAGMTVAAQMMHPEQMFKGVN